MQVRTPPCGCAQAFVVEQLTTKDYKRAKTLLNHGKHPTFIGRDTFLACARNGGVLMFRYHRSDCAVAMVNARLNVLLVLNVLPEHRAHGLGSAVLRYLQCNFARVLSTVVPWFERNGYQRVGRQKKGNRLYTQVMVKSALIPLAGRIRKLYESE